MTFNEFISFYTDIDTSISENRLFDVIRRIKLLCDKMTEADLSSRISSVESTYFYMLEYFVKGADDPMRDDMLSKLKNELYAINDELLRRLVIIKTQYPLFSGTSSSDFEASISSDNIDIPSLFYSITYAEHPVDNAQSEKMSSLINSANIACREKGLIISALFLSALRMFSENAISLLIGVYTNQEFDLKLRIKALIYIYFLSFRYSNRMVTSKVLSNGISLVTYTPGFSSHLALIMLQHLRCRNSDSLNAKVEKEIIPEIMKLSPKIKGLKKNNISIDEIIEANPEWEKMMQDSDLSSALKDISEFQFDGADIFLNTFKQLRLHIFFNKVHNWFDEFVKNTDLHSVTNISDEIRNVLAEAVMISDTDKFALALSMSGIGNDMQQMMIQGFREQADVLAQYNADKGKRNDSMSKLFVRNVMQDLYRFFKFVGLGKSVRNPFDYMPVSDINILITRSTLSASDIKACADYLLKYEYYSAAISYYDMLIHKSDPGADIYQKIGFCYQCLKNYPLAIDYYNKAEIVNHDNIWVLTHLAQSYKAMGNYDKAFDYYKRISELQPNNVGAILNIGHVCLAQEKLSEALQYYYQADFVSGGSPRTSRPIAWCEFLRGDYDKSKKYYDLIPDSDKNNADYLNLGHLFFVQSDYAEAERCYIDSIKKLNGDISAFIANYLDDESTIAAKNISPSAFNMMLDRVCFSYSNNKS